MAPMGPKNTNGPVKTGRNAQGTNKTHHTEKASTRNGISKRRTAPRVDRDGDLDMDTSTPGSARNRKTNTHTTAPSTATKRPPLRNPKSTAKTQQIIERAINGDRNAIVSTSRTRGNQQPNNNAPLVTLKVEGLQSSRAAQNEGGGLRDLVGFLERKAQSISNSARSVRIKKSQLRGDFVYVTTSMQDAEQILKVDKYMFAGTTLKITQVDGAEAQSAFMSETALGMKQKLQAFLARRYDVSLKLLNLSTLDEDPTLREMGFFAPGESAEKMFRAIMVVCDEIFPTPEAKRNGIVSITLAGNGITDVGQVMILTDAFPDVINLDLSRNSIKTTRDVQKWRHRLRSVQVILLNDNPIETLNPGYKSELVPWFKNLMNLSGTQVRTPEQVDAANKVRPLTHPGPDFRDIGGVGEAFIREFIPMFDIDRQTLAAKYYDDESTFTLTVDNSPQQRGTTSPWWGAYIKFSRNHKRITHPPSRQQRAFTGLGQIQSLWQQLPRTQHPDLNTQINLYLIDCYPTHGIDDPTGQSPAGVDGITMTIQGAFEDQDPNTMQISLRSFTRNIVLGPGAPGRNPVRVVNDSLTLKAHTPMPQPTASMQPAITVQPQATMPTTTEENKQKELMVMELCKQTGMTLDYSHLCLANANWDFNRAMSSFHEKKAQLPREAFATA